MNTEIKAPGEKFDIESHSLTDYIDPSQMGSRILSDENKMKGIKDPERRDISTAHVDSSLVNNTSHAGFAYDAFVSFCARLLLCDPMMDHAVLLFASNVLTLVENNSLDTAELKRRVEQLLPTASPSQDGWTKYKYGRGAKLAVSDFEQLHSLAERVAQCNEGRDGRQQSLRIVDDDVSDTKEEQASKRRRSSVKGDVQYIHHLSLPTPTQPKKYTTYPSFIEHNQEGIPSHLEYDKDITPFDSEEDEDV
ncbi:hypothetical protein G6F37_008035 [Rhizopus arrhizus]|nr:hypothetical protein G6F38_001716 [Rhizopus arrhizus]KAG1155981.1 hypothetical protein G6F37_008035 [Rhizopus arrhizus]